MAQATSPKRRHFSLLPYLKLMRLHQRTGIWLLLWPCWWSIALATDTMGDMLGLLLLFLIGAVVMRSAGCVVNDIWDRDIDPHVERTKTRPLASGVLNVKQAVILLGLLFAIGLGILLTLNQLTIALGLGFGVMVIVYPLMKRFINIPQLFLGATINAGALMGWSAATGEVAASAWLLYAACFFWTLGYDTIYAHQDKDDDIKIGVKSAALTFGKHTKINVISAYLVMSGLLLAVGFFHAQGWIYYLGIAVALGHLLWQILTVNLDDRDDCMSKFRSNGTFGWIIFIGIIISAGL